MIFKGLGMKDKHVKCGNNHNKHGNQPPDGEQKENPVSPEQGPQDEKIEEASEQKKVETVQQTPENEAAETGKEKADDKYLRLMADFDNFRRRTLRERNELYQRANEEIIEELLPVLDHLDLAMASAVEHKVDGGVVDGFKLVAEQTLSALKKFGVNPIDCAEGMQFDHSVHEAISHIPSATVAENTVITQVRRGYMLGSKMLRAAQVVVSSGQQQNTEDVKSAEQEHQHGDAGSSGGPIVSEEGK